MRSFLSFATLAAISLGAHIQAEEAHLSEKGKQAAPSTTEVKDIRTISKAFGHLIGQNLESLGLEFDMNQVIVGIQERIRGEASPMTESECIQAISMIQEAAFQKQCEENLKKAEEFLTKNKKEAGVIEIEPGKLQYLRIQEGTGEEVQAHFSPVIRYVGKFLDGKTFGESQDTEVICLDETILGFSKSIVGMKEGEKRRIFIHPEYAYGTSGFIPPNSLLTFEIEVVKANTTKAEEQSISKTPDAGSISNEIANLDSFETAIK
jgi:peptidylprolyl isomerase